MKNLTVSIKRILLLTFNVKNIPYSVSLGVWLVMHVDVLTIMAESDEGFWLLECYKESEFQSNCVTLFLLRCFIYKIGKTKTPFTFHFVKGMLLPLLNWINKSSDQSVKNIEVQPHTKFCRKSIETWLKWKKSSSTCPTGFQSRQQLVHLQMQSIYRGKIMGQRGKKCR